MMQNAMISDVSVGHADDNPTRPIGIHIELNYGGERQMVVLDLKRMAELFSILEVVRLDRVKRSPVRVTFDDKSRLPSALLHWTRDDKGLSL